MVYIALSMGSLLAQSELPHNSNRANMDPMDKKKKTCRTHTSSPYHTYIGPTITCCLGCLRIAAVHARVMKFTLKMVIT